MLTEIKNEYLTARISDLGAELKCLISGDKHYIWEGDPKFWDGSSPVLFPICSGLIDDTYYYRGEKFTMPKHGFAMNKMFEVESKSNSEVTFLLKDSIETLAVYPFHFEFRITYTLFEKKLLVKYKIRNTGENKMYFSVGAHEGYNCPGGIEDYDIILPKKTDLIHTFLTPSNTLGFDKAVILASGDVLPLDYKYFAEDALIFEKIDFSSLMLKNRKTGESVMITFEGFPYLLLWTRPGAPYICVEPWCGITDREGADQNIETKQGIECILPSQAFERTHSIEIL